MALDTMIAELVKAREEYNRQLNELGKNAAKGIAEYLAPLLPPGYTLQWTQYTPYFNDGDACTFSVYDPYLVKDGAEGDHIDDRGVYLNTALTRYGEPDVEKSFETTNYNDRKYDYKTGRYEYGMRTVKYTDYGFPAIDGYSKETLSKLVEAWKALPEDMMKVAFGDHVEVHVAPDGTYETSGYDHD